MDICSYLLGKKAGGGGGGSSNPYDLVIVADISSYDDIDQLTASDLRILSGSIEACEQKIANGQPVIVSFGYLLDYNNDGHPDIYITNPNYNEFSVTYRYIDFGSNPRIKYTSEYEFDEVIWD